MSLAHVKSLVVRFHPFHPHNSTIRHFLAQVESPAYQKRYVDCEMSCEVVHDRMVDPVIELVYENKSKLTVKCLGKSVADLFGEIQSVMEDSERIALEATPENDEENPYLAMAKQQEEKREAKRKKLLAQEKANKK